VPAAARKMASAVEFVLLYQRRHQQRHEKNPKDRQRIRNIHRPNQI
jgi:hypothetical protein